MLVHTLTEYTVRMHVSIILYSMKVILHSTWDFWTIKCGSDSFSPIFPTFVHQCHSTTLPDACTHL